MQQSRRWQRLLAASAAIALLATACGGDDEGEGDATETETSAETETSTETETSAGTETETSGGEMSMEDIQMGTGVSADPCPEAVNEDNGCITLGIISDFSGPFQTFGQPITEGQQAFWQWVNDNGGVAGMFDVALPEDLVADGQYNPQATAEAYQRLEPEVAALGQTLGTPQTQAIIPNMAGDGIVTPTLTWWSGWSFPDSDQNVVLESGSNYCVDAMNGMDWMLEQGTEITKVVHIGFPGDYGGDARAGVQAVADANDIEVVTVDQTPIVAGGDVTDAVSTILREQPEVAFITVGPQEAGQIIGGAAQQGYQGKFLGSHPVFLPDLMASPAAPAIEAMLTTVGPHEAWDGESEGHQNLRDAYESVFGGPPANDGATFGWTAEYPVLAALERAIENGDMTREGINQAVSEITVDYQGMLPDKSYGGTPADIIQRQTTIGQPNQEATLKLGTVEAAYTGPTAESYDFSEPCVTLG